MRLDRWNWLLAAMFLLVAAYAWRFQWTYAEISRMRAEVVANVRALSEADALRMGVVDGSVPAPELLARLQKLATETAGRPAIARAFEAAGGALRTGDGPAASRQLDAAELQLREHNRVASGRLGVLVDDTRYAAAGGLVFGGFCVLALAAALRALRNTERLRHRQTLLTRAASDGLVEWAIPLGKVHYSSAWRRLTGASGDTLEVWFDQVHPDDIGALRIALDAHLSGQSAVFEAEYRLRDHEGRWRWILSRGLADRGPRGDAQRMACWITDITERRNAAEAVERGAFLHHVADATGLGVLALGDSGEIVQFNDAATTIGRPWGSAAAMWVAVMPLVSGPTLTTTCAECGEAQREGSETVQVPATGGPRAIQLAWTGHTHRLVHGRRVSVVTVTDVTATRAAEDLARAANERLRASELELRAALGAMPEVVVVLDGERVLYRNAAATAAFAESADEGAWIAAFRADAGSGRSTHVRKWDGSVATFEVGAPVSGFFTGEPAMLLVAHDATARVGMEAQLRNAERMVALGGLAAGLAHEINNPLTYIIGNLELAQEGGGDVAERVSRALGGAVRVRQVVAQLRAMVNQGAGELTPVAVRPAVDAALGVASGVGLAEALMVVEVEQGLTVTGNPVWLGQILVNLVTNALHALADVPRPSRRVTVSAGANGERAWLEVADTGPGVAAAVRDRLFDPFVSTRLHGEGSGLGLYICRELAGRMGGSLTLVEGGPGARFRLELGLASVGAASIVSAPTAVAPPTGTPIAAEMPRAEVGDILLVDDDESIGEVVKSYLRGHRVHVISRSADAPAAFTARDWDLVILDIVLDDASGIELWDALAVANPAMSRRVLFVTGGSMTPDVARFLMETEEPTLVKPFDFRELSRLVDERVAARRSARA